MQANADQRSSQSTHRFVVELSMAVLCVIRLMLYIVYLLRERASTASNSPLYIHKPLAAFSRGPRYPTRVGPS